MSFLLWKYISEEQVLTLESLYSEYEARRYFVSSSTTNISLRLVDMFLLCFISYLVEVFNLTVHGSRKQRIASDFHLNNYTYVFGSFSLGCTDKLIVL